MSRRRRAWAKSLASAFALAISVGVCAAAEDGTLPVPRTTIYPGAVITDAVLVDRGVRRGETGLEHILRDRESIVGKVAKQTLLPDRPIPLGGVRDPFLVKQGQSALVTYQTGGLTISATAVSLEAGGVGDVISLRNPDSGTTIKGVIQANGTIRVGLP